MDMHQTTGRAAETQEEFKTKSTVDGAALLHTLLQRPLRLYSAELPPAQAVDREPDDRWYEEGGATMWPAPPKVPKRRERSLDAQMIIKRTVRSSPDSVRMPLNQEMLDVLNEMSYDVTRAPTDLQPGQRRSGPSLRYRPVCPVCGEPSCMVGRW